MLSIDLNKAFYLTPQTLCSIKPFGCCLHLWLVLALTAFLDPPHGPGEATADLIHYIILLDYMKNARRNLLLLCFLFENVYFALKNN